MTVWQDSLLSLCYDRPPIVSTRGWAPDAVSSQCELSYTNVMHYLCWIALRIISLNELGDPQPQSNLTLLAELDSTHARAQRHLLKRSSCKNLQQHLEHLALRMHTSFCMSVLCRPALKSRTDSIDPHTFENLRCRAKASLIDAAKAFLDFQALSVVPLRTWSMVHTVLSSTLLLCIWPETREDPECRDLQQRAIEVFSVFSSGNSSAKDTAPSDYTQWLSARHIRALVTLRQSLGNTSASTPGRAASVPTVQNLEPSNVEQQPMDAGVAPETMPMGGFPAFNDFFSGPEYG
jgi:hypothetical protein